MIKLNKNLFWDVDFNELDYEKDADFIISRVLLLGDLEDYWEIKKRYGLEKVKQRAKTSYLNKKSLYFWSNVFKISPKSFKCFKKSLIKKPGLF